jgi:hypothetical protein
MGERRGNQHETDVLVRLIDGHLARLAASRRIPLDDLLTAERIADTLRGLVADTTHASAHDRARVRAAVHFFVVRRDPRQDRRPARPLSVDVRVINEIMGQIGRPDLIPATPPVAAVPVAELV